MQCNYSDCLQGSYAEKIFLQNKANPTAAYGDSLDWKNLSADEITDRVLKKVKPGSIVLFHNAALHTPEALPAILERLQKDGYEVVPVSQLIIRDNFRIDTSGMQIPNTDEKTEEGAEKKSGEKEDKKTDSAGSSANKSEGQATS